MIRWFLRLVGVLIVLVIATYLWATFASSRRLAQNFESHRVDFPIPFPLPSDEVAQLGAGASASLAEDRAIERGRHLVEARYACAECHGENFGGGTMIDAFPIGTILGPNLTEGAGSRTLAYTAADWDRIVRHGILPDGRPAAMPSTDFALMSDQELADIVTFIRSHPPVDNEVAPIALGPLGKVLVATGEIRISAEEIDHNAAHVATPPAAAPTVEFGRHLAATCTGCHGLNFAGGPIAGGDPSWVPARNLTLHASGLADWDFEDFANVMRSGRRPDGTSVQVPMTFVVPAGQQMTDVELQAIWLYLQSVPPVPTPES